MNPGPPQMLVPALALVAGVMVFAVVHHFLIWVRRPAERAHVTFAAMCAVAAAWTLLGMVRYTTADPDTLLIVLRWAQTLGMTIGILLVWFVSQHLGVPARRFLWTLTAVQGALLVLNLLLPYGLMFGATPQPAFRELPWGEFLTYPVAPQGGGIWPAQVIGMVDFAFGFWATWTAWRRGDGRHAWPVAVALGLMAAGVFGVFELLLGPIPSRELAYLSLIVVMSLAVSNRVLVAGVVEQALAESEQRLRTLVETSPEAVLLLDATTGAACEANRPAEALFGMERPELVGVHPAPLAPPHQDGGEPSAMVFEWSLREAQLGGRLVFRWTALDRKGGVVPCEARLVRLPGTDPALFRLSLVDLRSVEEAEARTSDLEARLNHSQRLEAVGRLTGGVAHDFNNYLTVVGGNLELLMDEGGLQGDTLLLAQDALQAAQRSSELTRRLLAFARTQSSAPQRIELQRVVEGLVPMLRRTLGEDVRVEAMVQTALWPFEADPSQLESALVNLAINARDAMPGGGRIVIEAGNADSMEDLVAGSTDARGGPWVALSVVDAGQGMDPATLRRATEPFFTTKGAGRGTGLGLSMVSSFVVESGGALAIRSTRGEGTTVTMYFPRAHA
ncbi:MAG: PAS domain S-box protein [Gemmatimonadetes bacterium]|nr:PAS domain S-box protein [Gemmatimonadota bacterium]